MLLAHDCVCSANFLMCLIDTCLGVESVTVGWSLSHQQSLINAGKAVWLGQFLSRGFFLPRWPAAMLLSSAALHQCPQSLLIISLHAVSAALIKEDISLGLAYGFIGSVHYHGGETWRCAGRHGRVLRLNLQAAEREWYWVRLELLKPPKPTLQWQDHISNNTTPYESVAAIFIQTTAHPYTGICSFDPQVVHIFFLLYPWW